MADDSRAELIASARKEAEGLRSWHKLVPVGPKEPHTGSLTRACWDAGMLIDRLADALEREP